MADTSVNTSGSESKAAAKAKQHSFDERLKAWSQATVDTMSGARWLAETALEHFAEHGDVAYCQKFYDAMRTSGSNYVRYDAFIAWLKAFSPIGAQADNKVKGRLLFIKDKTSKVVFDVDKAKETPFWDFSPPRQIKPWSADAWLAATIRNAEALAKSDDASKPAEHGDQDREVMKGIIVQLSEVAATRAMLNARTARVEQAKQAEQFRRDALRQIGIDPDKDLADQEPKQAVNQ